MSETSVVSELHDNGEEQGDDGTKVTGIKDRAQGSTADAEAIEEFLVFVSSC
jgi:hypothetical protein